MSAHWIYVVPIAIAYLMRSRLRRRWSLVLKAIMAVVAVYLWVWNVALIVQYLYF